VDKRTTAYEKNLQGVRARTVSHAIKNVSVAVHDSDGNATVVEHTLGE